MKRSTKHRTTRWTDKQRPATPFQARDATVQPKPEKLESTAPVLGPYEAVYDVSLGYTQERAIVLP